MKSTFIRTASLLLLLLCINTSGRVAIMIDNDMLLNHVNLKSLNEDRNYTMGVAIIHLNDDLYEQLNSNSVFDNLFNFFDIKDKDTNHVYIKKASSWQLVSSNFTPDDITDSNVINDDRPYASLLFWGKNNSYIIRLKSRSFDHYTRINMCYRFGFIGLDIGKNVQTGIHDKMNDNNTKPPYLPMGWDHQISKGGEPTFFIGGDCSEVFRFWKITELSGTGEVGIGYHTYVSATLDLKLGYLPKSVNSFPIPSTIMRIANNKEESTSCFYLYGKLGGIGMLYNELLNGGLYRSDFKLDFNQVSHWMHFGEAGFYGMFCDWAGIQGGIGYKSNEISVGEKRNHFWGRVSFIAGRKVNPIYILRKMSGL